MRAKTGFSLFAWALGGTLALGGDNKDAPRPTPATRPEMKQLLEEMKARKPRIPLPPLSDEEKEKLGPRGTSYESRIRALYMPGGTTQSFGLGRNEADPNMSLDYQFKTQLFWIVSRANNCQYCLDHQESKLLATGMTEDDIAALDGDWAQSTPAQRAAYAFARKFTHEPNNLTDADLQGLRAHYKDLQILEMILSMAGNNAINRWKEGAGVPQSENGGGFRSRDGSPPKEPAPAANTKQTYLTPTSEKYKDAVSRVAALALDEKSPKSLSKTVCTRPNLETREEVEAKLAEAAKRAPRLPLVDEAVAREVLGSDWESKEPLPQWVRLLAYFKSQEIARILSEKSALAKGDLFPLMKAQASWIIALQDRAWYALGEAKKRLKDLGQTDDQIYALDGDPSAFSAGDQAMFTLSRILGASPVVLTDAEVEKALQLRGPKEVVQLISYTTNRASFDRITEAAGLAIEK